jgi:uncharacterized protein
MARFMLSWARKHKVSHIISSVAVKSNQAEKIIASGSTEAARAKLKETGIEVLEHGTIPGIPGALLNQGMINDQNVIVVLYNSMQAGPDFKSSAQLCMAMSKLVPGAVCDITTLQNEAEKAELALKEATEQTQHMKEGMYG